MRTTRSGPLSFDPVVVGNRETDAWAAYYRHDWRDFLVAAVGMVSAGFGMPPHRTLVGAWYILRANQLWAPYPDNQPDAACAYMRRFYELVVLSGGLILDPARAARLEVEWWRVHRAHQHEEDVTEEQLETALLDLYAYVYDADREAVRPAARKRIEAMDLSDRWVRAGCDRDDPLLAEERRALVASYAALRIAVER
ncbi:hypothetical protein EV643_115104 [Kribbella sp. VKM Ac-2527]|uniref:Uncharacterized protein n=1 Tax=Kribbella caucasensis TaxID=2512215 RepID=A0A4R6K894_9ACTN|nr:hypothetical protein [Kribbella sp. VKM Ac-2527]TDO44604.1 hypothetical protein EV643_115104 [Kribbella sp. VKM Ac-2527]